MKNLGQQLKALRKSAGLTYRDLGMHHNTIKAIETGDCYNSLNKYLERLESKAANSVFIQCGWEKKKENSTESNPGT